MSCDNLQGNGHLTQKLVVDYASLYDKNLADWIQSNVSFPNSMVDRITPATTQPDIDELKNDFGGLIDEWPVVAEDFLQWVVEDDFKIGRPDWGSAGALFVSDVIPYELMKLRLLNGSHSALAYLSYVHGHRKVDKATRDPVINRFIKSYMEECTATVPEVPGVDLTAYKAKLVDRFSNS